MAAITPVVYSAGYAYVDQQFQLASGDVISIRMLRRDAERACEGLGFKWSEAVVTLLILTREEMAEKFSSNHFLTKECWRLVSLQMKKKGYDIDGEQCDGKWRSLLKTYRKTKDHNNKSGNSRKTWIHLDDMDRILGKRPEMFAVATASSTGLEILRPVDNTVPPFPLPSSAPRGTKRKTVEELILQSMKEKQA